MSDAGGIRVLRSSPTAEEVGWARGQRASPIARARSEHTQAAPAVTCVRLPPALLTPAPHRRARVEAKGMPLLGTNTCMAAGQG
jgi:hypothetical protein